MGFSSLQRIQKYKDFIRFDILTASWSINSIGGRARHRSGAGAPRAGVCKLARAAFRLYITDCGNTNRHSPTRQSAVYFGVHLDHQRNKRECETNMGDTSKEGGWAMRKQRGAMGDKPLTSEDAQT